MGINSIITKHVSEMISRSRAKDEFDRVCQDADFSFVDDEKCSPSTRIDYALDELQREIGIIKKTKWTAYFSCGSAIGYALSSLVSAIVRGGLVVPQNDPVTITLVITSFICLLAGFACGLRTSKEEILLFWAAYANNLVDDHDEEIDQDMKDDVYYWTQKALRLI